MRTRLSHQLTISYLTNANTLAVCARPKAPPCDEKRKKEKIGSGKIDTPKLGLQAFFFKIKEQLRVFLAL